MSPPKDTPRAQRAGAGTTGDAAPAFDRRGFFQCAVAVAATVSAGCGDGSTDGGDAGPTAPGLPDHGYFGRLARDLTAAGLGAPQIMVDLDRLDANADAIVQGVGRARYRIVEKSLPSLDLLDHVRRRTGSDRFLVLHLPFLPAILAAFPDAQILMGKPHPTVAVARFLRGVPEGERGAVVGRVRFLADTRARLDELVALAAELSLTLWVGVEIDVGLHRGGVRRPAELPALLSAFVAHPTRIRLAGLLGYDGHVAHAPVGPGLEEATARAQHRAAEETYRAFVNALRADFASLVRDDLIFNGGGTATYPLYGSGPVNDVAAGGGMLRPASYPGFFTGALRPALFLAAPVLARFDAVELPFVSGPATTLFRDKQAVTISGGGWAAVFVSPPGVELAPLVADPENQNLVPNQTLLVAPRTAPLAPGDWVFHQPRQSDAIFQFEDILLVRGGRLLPERWRSFPRRY